MNTRHRDSTHCENCGAALQGPYCHVCGQAAHNPVKSVRHAVEETCESLWHLDGRIFRTVRDLLIPGRLALAYLSGQRTRYIPPFRLFVALSLLTFMVARMTVHLEVAAGEDVQGHATATEVVDKAAAPTGTIEPLKTLGASQDAGLGSDHPESILDWLPDFAHRWIDDRLERAARNLPQLDHHPHRVLNAFFASGPPALFVLVPLFAWLLRLLYVRCHWRYLEHVVVALYSHAFLCLDLLAILLLSALDDVLAPRAAWPSRAIAVVQAMLLLWMPLYLLWMQRRVYRQSRLVTVLKFLVLGLVHTAASTLTAIALAINSLAGA